MRNKDLNNNYTYRSILISFIFVINIVFGGKLYGSEDFKYNLLFKSSIEDIELPNNLSLLEGDVISLEILESDIYYFVGWYDGSNFYFGGENFVMPSKDIDLTAIWRIENKYRVLFDGMGHDVIGVPKYLSEEYNEGDTILITEEIPVRIGYSFRGWEYHDEIFEGGDIFTIPTPGENIVFEAQWSELFTVSYVLGDNGIPSDGQSYTFEGLISGDKIPTVEDVKAADGYEFSSWLRTLGEEGDGSVIGESDIVYTAVWTKLPNPNTTYSVEFFNDTKDSRGVQVDTLLAYQYFSLYAVVEMYSEDETEEVETLLNSKIRIRFPKKYVSQPRKDGDNNIIGAYALTGVHTSNPVLTDVGEERIIEYDLPTLTDMNSYGIPMVLQFDKYNIQVNDGVTTGTSGTPNGYTPTVIVELLDSKGELLATSTVEVTNKNYYLELRKYLEGGDLDFDYKDNTVRNLGLQDIDNPGYLPKDNDVPLTFRYNVLYAPYRVDLNYGLTSFGDVSIEEKLPKGARFDPVKNVGWAHKGDAPLNSDGSYTGGTVVYYISDGYSFRERYETRFPYSIEGADLTLTFPGCKINKDDDNDGNYIEENSPYLSSATLFGREYSAEDVDAIFEDKLSFFIKKQNLPEGKFDKYIGKYSFYSDDDGVVIDNITEKESEQWGYVLKTENSSSDIEDFAMEDIIMQDFAMDLDHLKFDNLGVYFDGEGEFKGDVKLQYTDDSIIWNNIQSAEHIVPNMLPSEVNNSNVITPYSVPESAVGVRLLSNEGSYLENGSNLYLVIDVSLKDSYVDTPIITEETNRYNKDNRSSQGWYIDNDGSMILPNKASFKGKWLGLEGIQQIIIEEDQEFEFIFEDGSNGYVEEKIYRVEPYQFTPSKIVVSNSGDKLLEEITTSYSELSMNAIEKLEDLHFYIQLPKGFEFTGNNIQAFSVDGKSSIEFGSLEDDSWYTIVDDWREEGRQTLVASLGEFRSLTESTGDGKITLTYNIIATKNIDKSDVGKYEADIFMTWDSHPYVNLNPEDYDEDLFIAGGIGENKDPFKYIHHKIDYTIEILDVLEAYVASKGVLDESYIYSEGNSNTDLGDQIEYVLTVENKTILGNFEDIRIINTLPYIDDKTVSPLSDVYETRGSEYEVYLTGPIEPVEGYSYRYSTDIGKDNIELFSDINTLWYLSDQIGDDKSIKWIDIKTVEITSEKGTILKEDEKIDFIYKTSASNNYSAINKSAVNSFAVKYDDKEFVESKTTKTKINGYIIDGYVFEDKNEDGIKDLEDSVLDSVGISIYKKSDLGIWNILEDKISDSNGYFSFALASKGEYRLIFETVEDYKISPHHNIIEDRSKILSNIVMDGDNIVSDSIELTLEDRESNINAGYILIKRYQLIYQDGIEEEDILIPVDNYNYLEGDAAIISEYIPERVDAIFTGWKDLSGYIYIGGSEVIFEDSDLILEAQWESRYYVKYDGAGSDPLTVPEDTNIYFDSSVVTISKMIPIRAESGIFYKFNGWEDQFGNLYPSGGTAIISGSDLLLTAKWITEDKYYVLYDGNGADGGEIPSDTTLYLAEGEVSILPELPTKTGSEFVGWSDNSSLPVIISDSKFIMPSRDVVLTAVWSMLPYNIYFETGSSDNSVTNMPANRIGVQKNDLIDISSFIPIRNGYQFKNWEIKYGSGSDLIIEDGVFSMVPRDLTFEAVWNSIDLYSVKYDGSGANLSTVPVDSSRYENNAIVAVSNIVPIRVESGIFYKFNGWKDQFGNLYPSGGTAIISGSDLLLTARWITEDSYSVLYDGNGNDGGEVPSDTTLYLAEEEVSILSKLPTKTGSEFVGWSDNSSLPVTISDSKFIMPSRDVVLTAVWDMLTYSISFIDRSGDSSVANMPSNKIGIYKDDLVDISSLIPERSGYEFGGWKIEEGSGSDLFIRDGIFGMVSRDLIFEATWIFIDLYSVKYDGAGADLSTVPEDSSRYKDNSVVNISTVVPIRTESGISYSFNGWVDQIGNIYPSGGTAIISESDLLLTARWISSTYNRYSVLYDGNGHDGGVVPTDGNLYLENDEVTVLSDKPTKIGNEFKGWLDISDTVDTILGSTFTMPSRNVVLTAAWKLLLYNIKFESGFDDGSVVNMPSVIRDLLNGDQVDIGGFIPEHEGYKFEGWIVKEGAGSDLIISDGVFSMIPQDLTFEATWSLINTYSILYDGDGADILTVPEDNNRYIDSSIVMISDLVPVRIEYGISYNFNGWIDQSGNLYPSGGTAIISESDLLLRARWISSIYNRYSVLYDGNGHDGGVVPTDGNLYLENDEVTVISGVPIKSGSEFIGWSDENNSPVAISESTFIMPSRNVILTAAWSMLSYNISFETGSDDDNISNMPSNKIGLHKDDIINIKNLTPTRTGYYFKGWSVKEGAGPDLVILDGIFDMVPRDLIFEAEWGTFISISDATPIFEEDKYSVFAVSLAEVLDYPYSIAYKTLDGTALAVEDYISVSDNLMFEAGSTLKYIYIEIIDDNLIEEQEKFYLVLDNYPVLTAEGVVKDRDPSFLIPQENISPVAFDDSTSVNTESTVDINILLNDTDDRTIDISSVIIETKPSEGEVIVDANGVVLYTHSGSLSLVDYFTYSVADTEGERSNIAKVKISIDHDNEPPQLNDGVIEGKQGEILYLPEEFFNNLYSDKDGDLFSKLTFSSIPTVGKLYFMGEELKAGDSVAKIDLNSITYSTDPNWHGDDLFSIIVTDSFGLISNIAKITVRIYPTYGPSAYDKEYLIDDREDPVITFNLLVDGGEDDHDNDPDGSGSIVTGNTKILEGSEPTYGDLINNGDGEFTYRSNSDKREFDDTFRYIIFDNDNLSDTATVIISVDYDIFIPKAFTPNGDGVNDQFELTGVRSPDLIEVTIVNRWGNLIYKSSDYLADGFWDGKTQFGVNKMSLAPTGSYLYIIKVETEQSTKVYRGSVYIGY